jgi:hypothetical protein
MTDFTPIFGTGFEAGSLMYPLCPGAITATSLLYAAATGHTGNYCCTQNGYNGTYTVDIGILGYTTVSDIYIGIWVLVGALDDIAYRTAFRFTLSDGKTVEICPISSSTSDVYQLWVDNALITTGTISFIKNQWHNIQIHLYSDVSAGRVELRVDGGLDINYTGNTKPGTSSVIKSFGFANMRGSRKDCSFDDISIGTGNWPGDIRYDLKKPIADTVVHDWLPTGIALQPPASAPTVGVSAGPGITGDFYYKVTFVDGYGETLGVNTSTLVQPSNQVVALTSIPVGLVGTTARKLYRTTNGGSAFKLVTTISDNTTTLYNDSLADGSLGVVEPTNTHWDKIDEVPPSSTDYIYIATDGAQDLHGMSQWDSAYKVPLYLVQWALANKGTADLQQFEMLLKSGSTLDESPALDLLSATQYYMRILTTDPNTGVAWDIAGVNAVQDGVKALVP